MSDEKLPTAPPSDSHRFFWPIVVVTVLLVISAGLVLYHLAHEQARLQSRITDCKGRLKGLGVYLALYESKFGCYPATFDDMKRPDVMSHADALICHADPDKGPVSYVYVRPLWGNSTPPDSIVAFDKRMHADGTRSAVNFSGTVTNHREVDFQRILADQLARERAALPGLILKARETAARPDATAEERKRALEEVELLEQRPR